MGKRISFQVVHYIFTAFGCNVNGRALICFVWQEIVGWNPPDSCRHNIAPYRPKTAQPMQPVSAFWRYSLKIEYKISRAGAVDKHQAAGNLRIYGVPYPQTL